MTEQLDVAIVGGGAAGISAARRLIALGKRVLLIEALPRLGGRAHTETIRGLALDMGCGWLHSAELNPLARLAEAEGAIIDKTPAAWRKQLDDIGITHAEQGKAWGAFMRWDDRLRENPPASDRAADAVAPEDERWRPFIDSLSSYINGAELDVLSIRDYLAYDDASTDTNWRMPGGYGAFIAGLAANIPVLPNTRVTSISHAGTGVTLSTARGDIQARAAIVAVSTSVLAKGAIRFDPAVDDHLHAAANLPLGLADKVFLAMADPEAVPVESHLLGSIDRAGTGSYYMRPLGKPVIECFLGGRAARALENAGEAAAIDFVTGELRGLLGANFAKGLTSIAITRWAHEPTICGSYSHALPGHADARAKLAGPVSERLVFAGEACSLTNFSTAHGAWESGIAAADHVSQSL